MVKYLKFSKGNAKLDTAIGIFDLPAGHSCPYAKDCYSKVNRKTGLLEETPETKFRCFAATSELISKKAREKRWYNFQLIRKQKTSEDIANLIIASIKNNDTLKDIEKFRIHTSGDFFSQKYFDAWLLVAKHFSNITFYAYTKSLKFWVRRINKLPDNLHLTASKGGKSDELIARYNLKNVVVVFSYEEAKEKKLEIDHDNSHCFDRNCQQFALLIHGTQPKDSYAMKSVMTLRKKGITGYRQNKKQINR